MYICTICCYGALMGINMLITVNARRRQTYTHACLARGHSVTQTRCIASLSEIDGAVQISPDQSPSAISASLSLLTQLPRCAGVVMSAREELLAIDLDKTTKAARVALCRRLGLPISGRRWRRDFAPTGPGCRQPRMPNLKRRALPPRREHRSPAQLDLATRRLTLAWRQQRRPSPNLQARRARRPRPSRLPRPALLVARSHRPTSRPLLTGCRRSGPPLFPRALSPTSARFPTHFRSPAHLRRHCGCLGGPSSPPNAPLPS